MRVREILYLPALLAFFVLGSACSDLLEVDDQAPKLIINVDTTAFPGTIDDTHKLYAIYFENDDWTSPWLWHGGTSLKIINPTVVKSKTYLAIFVDDNNSGTLDAGDYIAGYNGVTVYGNALTLVQFYPLEIKNITIPLTAAQM